MKRWDRFGLLEIMLLIGAVAVGISICQFFLSVNPIAGMIGATIITSSVYGPLVLVAQAMRGRPVRLSVAEWAWLMPLVGFVGFHLVGWIGLISVVEPAIYLFVLLHIVLANLSLREMILESKLATGRSTLRWTQKFGFWHTTLFLPLLIAFYILAFGSTFR